MWCARNQLLLLIVVFTINFNCYLSMTMYSCKKERKSYYPTVFFLTKIIRLLYLCLLMALKDMHMTLYHRMTSKTLCLRLVTYTSLDPVEHLVGLCTLERQTTQQFGHTWTVFAMTLGKHAVTLFFLSFDQIKSVELFQLKL